MKMTLTLEVPTDHLKPKDRIPALSDDLCEVLFVKGGPVGARLRYLVTEHVLGWQKLSSGSVADYSLTHED